MARWILRKGSKRGGFRYAQENGRPIGTEAKLRIAALRIPPAWREVRVAVSPRAGIQAWGYDARGRKQYRYNAGAVRRRELRKHHRVRQLARDLPTLRARLHRDSRRRGYSREKVAAGVARLIAEGFFRVGSERYVEENRTFGITTLRKSHVTVWPGHVELEYHGKRRKRQKHMVADAELGKFLRAMLRTRGPRLFRYQVADGWRDFTADDLNDYLREIAGFPYTAKDLRTWGGTLRAATVLAELGRPGNEREARKNAATAIRLVAAELGNTPAICRNSYVHPEILERYIKAREIITLPRRAEKPRGRAAHTPEEKALLRFLDEHFPDRRSRRRAQ